VDYVEYTDLEQYLFKTVSRRFKREGELGAFDVLTIVRWKADRVFKRMTARLLKKGHRNLDSAARALTRQIANGPAPKDRLRVLVVEWGFRLPMASAVLSVCYPKEFTVYDVRVCRMLDGYRGLDAVPFERMWEGYQKFMSAVNRTAPPGLSLRDKDRWLWGKSRYEELRSRL
jgi:hypothetical protein